MNSNRTTAARWPLCGSLRIRPAAKASIHCSDFVVAINGVPVPGREFSNIVSKDIHGPVGGTIRLTVVRFDGSQSEITLVRAPYPPHPNPASDPFVYSVPGSWTTDPRYPFPLPWSPALSYHGFEDLFYAPNFDQTDSPEYHSYLFFLWLEGAPPINEILHSTVDELAAERYR